MTFVIDSAVRLVLRIDGLAVGLFALRLIFVKAFAGSQSGLRALEVAIVDVDVTRMRERHPMFVQGALTSICAARVAAVGRSGRWTRWV